MRVQLLILFVLFFSKTYAQKETINSLKILHSIHDSNYNVALIPDTAFDGEFDVLVMPSIANANNEIAIHWLNYFYDDKQYRLVINPKQIYFRSINNTPNPKYLFWKSNISEAQFLKIKNYIQGHTKDIVVPTKNNKFSYWFKKSKVGKNKTQPKYTIEMNRTYKNFKRILNFLNQSFIANKNRIDVPKRGFFKKSKSIRVVYDISDLDMEMTLIPFK